MKAYEKYMYFQEICVECNPPQDLQESKIAILSDNFLYFSMFT